MATELTKVTPEEIAKLRAELADNSNPKVIADLDVIKLCEGNLIQAARVLARRAGMIEIEKRNADENWQLVLQKAREIVCDDKFKEGLVPGLIGGLIGALATSGSPLVAAVATPTSIYIAQFGIDAFCQANQLNSED